MKRASPRPILVASFLAVGMPFILAPATVRGQPSRTPPMTGAGLERFVPASAGFYVSTSSFGRLDRGLRRTHAWQLRSVLVGGAAGDANAPELATTLGRILGARLSVDPDDLTTREMALVARSWPDFAGSVLLVRAPEDDLVDRWFPVERRSRSDVGHIVRSFRTDDGLIVIRRGDVLAMGRYLGRDSLVVAVMALLRGASDESLAGSAEFQRLRSHLPPRALAEAYIGADRSSSGAASVGLSILPGVEQAVVGIYEDDRRLELAVRGAVTRPVLAHSRLPIETVERMLSLPRTTLAAAATTIDFTEFARATEASDQGDLTHRIWNLYLSLRRLGAPAEPDLPSVGPSAIVAWDQDLSNHGTTPQGAVLLQCVDARMMTNEVSRVADNILRVLAAIDPELSPDELRIEESRHLGVRVRSLPLGRILSGSTLAIASLLSNLEPAWAASGDWLILALGRDHLERILDARFGLVPTLGLIDDTRAVRRNPNRQTGVFVLQGGMAADLMDRWLADATSNPGSLLAPAWWARIVATEADRRLGLTMQQDEETGFVRVQATATGTPAADLLRRGDRIVALDGVVLDLGRPVADLRMRWLQATPGRSPTLRVLRDGAGVDIAVPPLGAFEGILALQVQPLDAVRELALLVRGIPLGTFVVYATDEWHYSARVTLRLFTPEQHAERP